MIERARVSPERPAIDVASVGLGEPGRPRDRDAVSTAVAALRAMIATGKIPPGAELSQVGLARSMGISTTPLREALQRLEAEGLVEQRRNRRPRVPPFDAADLDTVYGSRILIESLGVALAAPKASPGSLAAQRELLLKMEATTDLSRWDGLHTEFHLGLMGPDGTAVGQEVGRLMARSEHYRRISVRADGAQGRQAGDREHEEILLAYSSGEGVRAALALAHHLARSALTVLAHLDPAYDPVSVRGALRMVIGGAGETGGGAGRE